MRKILLILGLVCLLFDLVDDGFIGQAEQGHVLPWIQCSSAPLQHSDDQPHQITAALSTLAGINRGIPFLLVGQFTSPPGSDIPGQVFKNLVLRKRRWSRGMESWESWFSRRLTRRGVA